LPNGHFIFLVLIKFEKIAPGILPHEEAYNYQYDHSGVEGIWL
jgi:hypothetical protein